MGGFTKNFMNSLSFTEFNDLDFLHLDFLDLDFLDLDPGLPSSSSSSSRESVSIA